MKKKIKTKQVITEADAPKNESGVKEFLKDLTPNGIRLITYFVIAIISGIIASSFDNKIASLIWQLCIILIVCNNLLHCTCGCNITKTAMERNKDKPKRIVDGKYKYIEADKLAEELEKLTFKDTRFKRNPACREALSAVVKWLDAERTPSEEELAKNKDEKENLTVAIMPEKITEEKKHSEAIIEEDSVEFLPSADGNMDCGTLRYNESKIKKILDEMKQEEEQDDESTADEIVAEVEQMFNPPKNDVLDKIMEEIKELPAEPFPTE